MAADFRKQPDRFLFFFMLSDHPFHPDHIIPMLKFIATLIKGSDQTVPQMFMEVNAVIGKMRILPLCAGNAGVHIQDPLLFQPFLQRMIETPSQPPAFLILPDINRGFHCPVIRRPALETAGISITQDPIFVFCHQIRMEISNRKQKNLLENMICMISSYIIL